MKELLTFRDLAAGEYFVFAQQPSGLDRPCQKTGERTYVVLDTETPGRVGVGDNPVVRRPAAADA